MPAHWRSLFRIAAATMALLFIALPNIAMASCAAHAVPSPNLTSSTNQRLNGVSASSTKDAWAVGWANVSGTTCNHNATLSEHWNGAKWSLVPTPNVGKDQFLLSTASISVRDAWAVGAVSDPATCQLHTLTEHWNGTAWLFVPSPNVTSCGNGTINSNQLSSVTAVATNDVWAVGYANDCNGFNHVLAEHWNGKAWSVIPLVDPGAGRFSLFTGVSKVSSTDVWAVGSYDPNYTGTRPLAEHWNGHTWSLTSTPHPQNGNYFYGVGAVSAKDVWAVGSGDPGFCCGQPFIDHWTGAAWQNVTDPSNATPLGVAGTSSGNVWSVGGNNATVERWNGSGWTVVPSDHPGYNDNILYGVGAVPGSSSLWAVGLAINPGGNNTISTLIESLHC